MAEVKDKVVTVESLKALHDYNENTYLKTSGALTTLGITATAEELNTLDGITATTTELNILDGATVTTTELNYVDGVTSNIQTQLNGKAASSHTHNYLSLDGGTVNGDTNIAAILKVEGQQAFYYDTSAFSQVIGTNNASGGTTICAGSSANVIVNGANLLTANIAPRDTGSYSIGTSSNRYYSTYLKVSPNVSSDERLKRNIADLDGDSLANFINKLNVISYNYKDDEEDAIAKIGLTTQNVQQADADIAKFFVEENEDGYYSLRPSDLVFPLIATVQKLTKEVEELKAQLSNV